MNLELKNSSSLYRLVIRSYKAMTVSVDWLAPSPKRSLTRSVDIWISFLTLLDVR